MLTFNLCKKPSEVTQSCPTLRDPMDCSLPDSSVHGIFQARILEWVTISFSRGSSRPRDGTWVSRTAGRLFAVWASREALSSVYAYLPQITPSFITHLVSFLYTQIFDRYTSLSTKCQWDFFFPQKFSLLQLPQLMRDIALRKISSSLPHG